MPRRFRAGLRVFTVTSFPLPYTSRLPPERNRRCERGDMSITPHSASLPERQRKGRNMTEGQRRRNSAAVALWWWTGGLRERLRPDCRRCV